MTGSVKRARRSAGPLIATLAVALSLSACAPEPSESSSSSEIPGEIAGGGKQGSTEHGTQATPPPEAYVTQTALPDGFPAESFRVPEGATIFDVGERGSGQWFLVLSADSGAAADALWSEVIATNELTNEGDDPETGYTVLTSSTLRVDALRIPEAERELLNYDIAVQ